MSAAKPAELRWQLLSDDGGYCWFQSPRALFHGGQLLVGSVASGARDPIRQGNVEVLVHDRATRETESVVLHAGLESDDHDAPAFAPLQGGRVLALYTRHDRDASIRSRISEPHDARRWAAERSFVPSESSRVTYSNVFRLQGEQDRLYDFYRGLDDSFKPSYAWSDDDGQSWQSGNVFINVPSSTRQRPYVCYASDGDASVHMLYTPGHPRDVDNGLFHACYRRGVLHQSDGSRVRSLALGLRSPDEGTCIFAGSPDQVAWAIEIGVGPSGLPHALYSVQVGSAGLPVGEGGGDLRYRVAHFDGRRWHDRALAFAGSRLYAGEDDYSGLAAFDPDDPFTVYLSTNAHPRTGESLVSAADGQRHHELFVAQSQDQGDTWSFSALTRDSRVDYLRPLLARAPDGEKALIALAGRFPSFRSYDQRVLALFFRGSLVPALAAGRLPAPPLSG